MQVDVLVAEIGSTTTVLNAFDQINSPRPVFVGQGQSFTTVEAGDVSLGLELAMKDLAQKLKVKEIKYSKFLATSSAAGGLKMTVHGLVYEMTARAAKEAALGSGAVIKLVTAGKLRAEDLAKVKEAGPNIILLAGGIDYGERETAIFNFKALLPNLNCPLIYAGNIENKEAIQSLAKKEGKEVFCVDNVYPALDQLRIEESRSLIQEVFEANIVKSKGMSTIRKLVSGSIMPSPGAVMEASLLYAKEHGDVLCIDIGGATTDLHSVTEGNLQFQDLAVQVEPRAKRTVEGDLGVFLNRACLFELFAANEAEKKFLEEKSELPIQDAEVNLVAKLGSIAAKTALDRHAGSFIDLYGPSGKKSLIKGKDLTAVKTIIGTGGVLTRNPGGARILEDLVQQNPLRKLLPPPSAKLLIDNYYIMASLGVLAKEDPESALLLLEESLRSSK